jgi:ABC-2 type transport system permease protein
VSARPVRARDFVRLKLRLIRNGLRGNPTRVLAFVLAGLFGAGFALAGFAGLAVGSSGAGTVAFSVAVIAGTVLVIAWSLVPVLFFGIDETLDPARFALLPVRAPTLLRGMFAAAFVGVPAVATLLASLGLVVGRFVGDGFLPGMVALVGVVLGLMTGVAASRAISNAMAAMLRSRRVRDLAAVIIAGLAASISPIQWLIMSATQHGNASQALSVARVLSWTPFGAPYALPFDVADGRWLIGAARLAITVATIALLLLWWATSIESAMLGAAATGQARAVRGTDAGAVAALLPKLLPATVFGAITAREARSWWRDGRRRAGLISVLIAGGVVPIAIRLSSTASKGSGQPSAIGVTVAGTVAGMVLANQLAYDGNAYAAHLLARVRGVVDLRARATALAMVVVPVLAVVQVAVLIATGAATEIPEGLGLLLGAFGCSVAAAGTLSVFAAYPMPESTNPFAMNAGGASAKGFLSLVAVFATLLLAVPLIVAEYLLGSSGWVLLPLGIGYGLGMAFLGTSIAGDALDRRGPRLLIDVTSTR